MQHFLDGGVGYGDAKKVLAETVNNYLRPYREKYNELMADKSKIDDALAQGAKRARDVASKTLYDVKKTLGLI